MIKVTTKWFGYDNGYVGVPRNHPAYGRHYEEMAHIRVPGGLTFSGSCLGGYQFQDYWFFGFDTCHGDVLDGIDSLYKQLGDMQ